MADQKVSDLPSLNGADVDAADLLYVVDSSAGTAGSKKITVGQYQLAPYSAGTANGVMYLNGSNVVTTGSELVFNATGLGIGTSSPAGKLHVAGSTFRHNDVTGSFGYTISAATNTTTLATLFGGSSFAIQTGASGTNQLLLDSSGNLGLGVTPSAWGAGAKAVQFSSGAFAGVGTSALSVGNAYFDGTNYRYLANGFAAYHAVNNGAGQHAFYVAPSGTAGNAISFTQAMTLDASGNLAVGTSSTVSSRIHAEGAGVTIRLKTTGAIGSGSTCFLQYDDSAGDSAYVGFGGTANSFDIYNRKNGPMLFGTNNTESARITSAGVLLVGLASPTFINTQTEILAATNNNAFGAKTTQNNYAPLMAWNSATTGDNLFQYFYTEGTLTLRGSIDYNRAGGLVRYNTTSDYRAKDILGPVADPGATIDALKVYEGRMKGATQSRPMLVAHEAQEHAPYAVSGEKDEVNEDGSPKFQQIDVSSLVPLLLAEIQSLRARVAALEAQ